MTHPLDGPFMLIKRAYEQLTSLQGELIDWEKDHPPRAGFEDEPEGLREGIDKRLRDSPPARHAMLAGEFIHTLRCVLDHLVWAMSDPDTVLPGARERIYFPIFWKPETTEADVKRRIARCPVRAQTIIQKMQPYRASHRLPQRLLWMIADLDNTAKHRTILLAKPKGRSSGYFIASDRIVTFDEPIGEINDYDALQARLAEATGQQEFEPNATVGITFAEPGPADGWLFLRTLQELHSFVRWQVLPDFMGFFPEAENPFKSNPG